MSPVYSTCMQTVGIDEVGRGCWAGPLVAGAVVLAPVHDTGVLLGLRDSKKLSRLRREELAAAVYDEALAVGLGWVWPEEIDRIGLTASVARAMALALEAIDVAYGEVIIDGNYNFLPQITSARTVIKADDSVPAVSAASIVAKVARDAYMTDVAAPMYPQYGFENHVGYGTELHIAMLHKHGASPIHRQSYKPIKNIVLSSNT